jgi:NUMOD3 motif
MAIHHIIPKHEWRKRFGSLIGFNCPENRVTVTTEQHAQIHMHYFNEITHIEYDRIAGITISGQIGKDEAFRLAHLIGNLGKKMSKETRAKMSARGKGKILSDEHRKKLSEALKGNKNPSGTVRSAETRRRMSIGKKAKLQPINTLEKFL